MRLSENLSEQGEGIYCKVVYGSDRVVYEDVTEDVAKLEKALSAELAAVNRDYARFKAAKTQLESENEALMDGIKSAHLHLLASICECGEPLKETDAFDVLDALLATDVS